MPEVRRATFEDFEHLKDLPFQVEWDRVEEGLKVMGITDGNFMSLEIEHGIITIAVHARDENGDFLVVNGRPVRTTVEIPIHYVMESEDE